ncbi:MAG: nucleotidyltransferase domain-containing protein [Anaerolineae bacterium]
MIKWPDAETVEQALRDWAEAAARSRSDLVQIGFFGSHARGDWGVGSDLDVIIIVTESEHPFLRRSATFGATALPVSVDLLAYARWEWGSLGQRRRGVPQEEVTWVYRRDQL